MAVFGVGAFTSVTRVATTAVSVFVSTVCKPVLCEIAHSGLFIRDKFSARDKRGFRLHGNAVIQKAVILINER